MSDVSNLNSTLLTNRNEIIVEVEHFHAVGDVIGTDFCDPVERGV